ncbi:MAG: O-methyltransferase [Cyclobacteriaceae bacterium]
MEFIEQDLQKYVVSHTEAENPLLQEINRETHVNVLRPRMLSGHLQGRMLSMLSHMIKPSNILEIGTYTGYSALCLAEGLQPGGKLITIEVNEELEERIKRNFAASVYDHQIELKIGNATDIIPRLSFQWDLVFIDADKANYLQYYEMVIDHVPKGRFIIVDNVLWSGKVLEKYRSKVDKDTEAILAFNEKVHRDDRVSNVLFPVRDGIMILRKN